MMRVANPCPKTGSWLETNQGAAGPLLTRPFDTAAQLMMSNRITPAWDNEVRKRLRFSGWPRSPAALSAASLERSEAHGEGSDPLNQAVLRTIQLSGRQATKVARPKGLFVNFAQLLDDLLRGVPLHREMVNTKGHDMNPESTIEADSNGPTSWIPTLGREERQELAARIRREAAGGPDFFIMMALAATLASLGLLQGSTAVVIGAMLVAPLVGPLLGAALALVQGNVRLMRISLTVALAGIALGFAISIGFGAINPGYEPTLEVESRGRPDLFDLGIALVSGMVAAYAETRRGLSNTLAGVAIAAALLPPLAVVGIAMMGGEVRIATYAVVLLMTNLVAIILGAALVFRLMGVRARAGDDALPSWARQSIAGMLILVTLLSAPLLLQGMEKSRVGQNRPYSYPTSVPVREAVGELAASETGMEVIFIARNGVEPGAFITVVLAAANPPRVGFRREVRNVIRQQLGLKEVQDRVSGEEAIVRVYIIQQAPSSPDEPLS